MNSTKRILCISSVQNNCFDIMVTLDGYLFGNGMLGIDNNIFLSVYNNANEAFVYKYNIINSSFDKRMELPYFSNNVDIFPYMDNLALLDCSRSDNGSEKKIIYISKNLTAIKEYAVFHNLRMYDFQKDCIICSDGHFIYVYDLDWNENGSFALNGVQGMKFSGLFKR